MSRRTALITGASAGIGAALAREFAAHGFDVVLTARREDRLKALAEEIRTVHGVHAHILLCDLAEYGGASRLAARIQSEGFVIDALANNAGYGLSSEFSATPWCAQQDFLQVLAIAPCELTRALLPSMIARGYGRIINVASVAAFLPGAKGHTLYPAVKSFLVKFSRSLHMECQGTGVFVSALCPGFTYTEFHDVAGTRERVDKLPRLLWYDASRVAREGYKAVMANRAVHVVGWVYLILLLLMRLIPDDWICALDK